VNESIKDSDKGTLASTRLRGNAFKWIMLHLQRYIDDNDIDADITLMFEDWTEFKKRIRQIFGLHKETAIAERNI
jgi:hypothetical protein